MAPTKTVTKRKSDEAPAATAKATKKVKTDKSTTKTKTTTGGKTTVVVTQTEVKPAAAPVKKSRAQAADFFDEKPAPKKPAATKEKATPEKKTSKKATKDEVTAPTVVNGKKETNGVTPKGKKGKAQEEKAQPAPAEIEPVDDFSDSEDDQIADQAANLLAGFESDSESEGGEGEGVKLDDIPAPTLSRTQQKKLDVAKRGHNDAPGVVYVGHIPHGFYEHQMRAYFSQFGNITNLRLSRNKKTGASKHFAFIEFDSASVADIVSRTMDKYLLFNHILNVRVIPNEQIHADLWKGANRRFKVIPHKTLEGRKLAEGKTREQWEKKTEKVAGRRKKQAEKLKELGYEFDMPAIKSVSDVPLRGAAMEAAEQPLAIEAAPEPVPENVAEEKEETATKGKKKSKKSKTAEEPAPIEAVDDIVIPAAADKKKRKKIEAVAAADTPAPTKKQKTKAAEALAPKKVKKTKA